MSAAEIICVVIFGVSGMVTLSFAVRDMILAFGPTMQKRGSGGRYGRQER